MRERKRWPLILCVVVALLGAYMLWSSDNVDGVRKEIQRQEQDRVIPETDGNMSEGSRAFMSSTAPPVKAEPVSVPPLVTLPPPPNTTAKRLLPKSPPPAQCLCPSPGKLKEFGPRKRVQRMGNTTENPGCILLLHRIAVSRVDIFHYRLWVESPAEHRQVSKIAAACPVVLLTDCVFCPDQFRQVKFDVKRRRVGGRPKVGGVSDTAVLVLHRVWEQGPYHAIVDPGLVPMYVMAETVAENVASSWFTPGFRKGLVSTPRRGTTALPEQLTNLSSSWEPIPNNYTGEYYLHRFTQPGKWRMIVAESFRARSERKVRWTLSDISATLMKPLTVLNRRHAGWFQIKKPVPKNVTNSTKPPKMEDEPPELAVRGSREGWFAVGQVNWLSFWGWKDAVRTSTEEERLPAHPLTAYEVRRFRRHAMRVCHHAYPPRNQPGIQAVALNDTVVVDIRHLAFVNDRLRGIPTEFINQVIRPTFGSLNIPTYPVSLWELNALETVRLLRENKFYFGSEGAFFSWMLLASDESTWFMLHPTTRQQREWRPVSYHMTFARYLNGPSLVAFDVPYVANVTPSPLPSLISQTSNPSASAEPISAVGKGPMPTQLSNPSSVVLETDAFAAIRFPPSSYVREIIQSFLSISQSNSSSPPSSTTSSLPMVAPIKATVVGLPYPPPSCRGRFSVVRADLTANEKRRNIGDAADAYRLDSVSNYTTVWETVWLAPVFCVWERS